MKFDDRIKTFLEDSKTRKTLQDAIEALNKAGIALEYALEAEGINSNKFEKELAKIKDKLRQGKY